MASMLHGRQTHASPSGSSSEMIATFNSFFEFMGGPPNAGCQTSILGAVVCVSPSTKIKSQPPFPMMALPAESTQQ